MLANPLLGVSAKCSMVSFGSSYRSTVEVGKGLVKEAEGRAGTVRSNQRSSNTLIAVSTSV
jgi:hypothetical protein